MSTDNQDDKSIKNKLLIANSLKNESPTDEQFIQSLYDELSEDELDPHATNTKADLDLPSTVLDQKILAAAHKAVAAKPQLISNHDLTNHELTNHDQASVSQSKQQPSVKASKKTPAWFSVVAKAASVVLVVTLVIDQMDYPFVPPSKIEPMIVLEQDYERYIKVDGIKVDGNEADSESEHFIIESASVLVKASSDDFAQNKFAKSVRTSVIRRDGVHGVDDINNANRAKNTMTSFVYSSNPPAEKLSKVAKKTSRQGVEKVGRTERIALLKDESFTVTEMFVSSDEAHQLNSPEKNVSGKNVTARLKARDALIANKKVLKQQKQQKQRKINTSQMSLLVEADEMLVPPVVEVLSQKVTESYLTVEQYSKFKALDNQKPIFWLLLEDSDVNYLIQLFFTDNKIHIIGLIKKHLKL
ncbi:MAG: hypothetical protein HRT38_18505 [Alteromonadaceae bacterium]|nr:hypothetical protein [Alteromonadaceae bacterium]